MRTKFTEFKAAVATTSSVPSKTRLAHDEPVARTAPIPSSLSVGCTLFQLEVLHTLQQRFSVKY